eukprot:gene2854-3546_t
MYNKILSLVFVILLVQVIVAAPDNDPVLCKQKVRNEDCPTVPRPFDTVDDDDVIDVYYLQAPLFEGMFGDLFGKLGGYHSAVGFYDRTTGINYTAEYDAYFEVANGTFPNVLNTNGSKELLWCNAGILCTFPYINETYWDPAHFSTASKTYMATINGALFNKFNSWMVNYNETFPIYQTWTIWDQFGKNNFLQSTTCDDFTSAAFDFLHTVGVNYNCSTIFKRDFLNLYSEKPVPVDWETEQDSIMKFYEVFDFKTGGSIMQLIKKLFSVIGLKKYIYVNGDYYRLSLNYPFIDLRYAYVQLPGCPMPPRDDEKHHIIPF